MYDALNNKNPVIGVFIDFLKDFETVNYENILLKLEKYGITGVPLS